MSAQQYWDRVATNQIVLGLKEKEVMHSVVPAFRRSKSMAPGALKTGQSMKELSSLLRQKKRTAWIAAAQMPTSWLEA
jgi:hypothetical protein